jgi:hypothetical protein
MKWITKRDANQNFIHNYYMLNIVNQGKVPLGLLSGIQRRKTINEQWTINLKKIRLIVIEQKSHSALLRADPYSILKRCFYLSVALSQTSFILPSTDVQPLMNPL